MQVSNKNIQQFNINNSDLYNPAILQSRTRINDRFVKGNNNVSLTSPNYVTNPSVNSLYSPIQLLKAYSEKEQISKMIQKNPKITQILEENNIDPTIYTENVRNIINTHLMTTNAYALQIANEMGISYADKKTLEKACIFHDFGKTLIPKELIEKPGQLTPEEKSIVNLHAELGYELLSTTGMDKKVLELVRNHHMPHTEQTDILSQILSVADIYSALREERSYKASMSEKEALHILDQKAIEGEVSTEVVNALKSSLKSVNVA